MLLLLLFWTGNADVVLTRGSFAGAGRTEEGRFGVEVASISPENIANEKKKIFHFHSSILLPQFSLSPGLRECLGLESESS